MPASGVAVVARHDGMVEGVDAGRIVVRIDEHEVDETGTGVDIYNLVKFIRSNQNTCLNQKPIVKVGDQVKVQFFESLTLELKKGSTAVVARTRTNTTAG